VGEVKGWTRLEDYDEQIRLHEARKAASKDPDR
jgi:hypothetical protein